MIYPFSKELQGAARDFANGNFGLWFNKLVPLDDKCGACADTSDSKNTAQFYRKTYDRLKQGAGVKNLLIRKHADQKGFCRLYREIGSKVIEIRAELCSPLITGIGRAHPSEVGMTLDHIMGIPYLPAEGIKGLVRVGHVLSLLEDREKSDILVKGDELNDRSPISRMPQLFGGALEVGQEVEKRAGKVIFLDAYPEKIPDLHVDIMNPHYGDYYSSETGRTAPADYLSPVPIQFLTVKQGEVFVFRSVIFGSEYTGPLFQAFSKALTVIGMGAKTAVGYGRFRIIGAAPQVGNFEIVRDVAPEPTPKAVQVVWKDVTLTFSPGNQLITAKSSLGTATANGTDIIPEAYRTRLVSKRKAVKEASVTVEPVGRSWKIVGIK